MMKSEALNVSESIRHVHRTSCGHPSSAACRRTTHCTSTTYATTNALSRQVIDAIDVTGVAPRAGLEPATLRLTAGCSAIELPRIRAGETLDLSIRLVASTRQGRSGHPSPSRGRTRRPVNDCNVNLPRGSRMNRFLK